MQSKHQGLNDFLPLQMADATALTYSYVFIYSSKSRSQPWKGTKVNFQVKVKDKKDAKEQGVTNPSQHPRGGQTYKVPGSPHQ